MKKGIPIADNLCMLPPVTGGPPKIGCNEIKIKNNRKILLTLNFPIINNGQRVIKKNTYLPKNK